MKQVLVGCPVRDRGWILNEYIAAVNEATSQLENFEFHFIFLVSPQDDSFFSVDLPEGSFIYYSDETDEDYAYKRNWGITRYEDMAAIRNQLLGYVRALDPDYFISLDSDILIHRDSLVNMFTELETNTDYSALGGKVYLSESGRNATNYGYWLGPDTYNFSRQDSDLLMTVDILMAFKIMNREAYHVDYEAHKLGEDLGWSKKMREAKLRMRWDGRITNKHVFERHLLDQVDYRCGY